MFISPALEELTGSEPVSQADRSQSRAVPSSVHHPPSVEGEYPDSAERMTAKGSGSGSDFESFQRDLARQLVGVDQQTFQNVKQAIQSALNSQGGSADPSSVIQTAQHQVHEVLHSSGGAGTEETKSYYATVADAVTSAGTAIGQLSNQVFGGGDVQHEVAGEEATMKAEEALLPLKQWLHTSNSTEHSAFTQQEQQQAPTGYFTRESKTTQDSGPNNMSASQHTSEAGRWTTGETGTESAHTYERQATDSAKRTREAQMQQGAPYNSDTGSWTTGDTGSAAAGRYEQEGTDNARGVREAQMEQGALQNASDLQERPMDNFSRSSHRQSQSTNLQGDAQNVGLEEAQRRARHPF